MQLKKTTESKEPLRQQQHVRKSLLDCFFPLQGSSPTKKIYGPQLSLTLLFEPPKPGPKPASGRFRAIAAGDLVVERGGGESHRLDVKFILNVFAA